MSINFAGNPYRFSIVLLLRFIRCLKQKLNMMVLHKIDKVHEMLTSKTTIE